MSLVDDRTRNQGSQGYPPPGKVKAGDETEQCGKQGGDDEFHIDFLNIFWPEAIYLLKVILNFTRLSLASSRFMTHSG